MNVLVQTFERALQYHQAGNLQQAEALYRQILQSEPRHADARHLLGVLAHQAGRSDLAIPYIQQAIQLQPAFPEAYNNLGIVQMALGKPAEAAASFRHALILKPGLADGHNNLGLALRDMEKHAEAAASFQQAVRLKPDHAEAYFNLGTALAAQEKLAEAVVSYKQALRLRPDYAEAHNNLGNALKAQGKLDEAIASYRQSLRAQPGNAQPHYNLGVALASQGNLEEAVASYQQALRLNPNLVQIYNNLGNALTEQGKLEEAIASYREALRRWPDFADAYHNLAKVLIDQGKNEEAIVSCRQALRLQPDFADAYHNLGNALKNQGKFDESIASYRQALRLQPGHAEAQSNLGNVLKSQGQLDATIAAFRQALAMKPDSAAIHSNLVFILNYHPDFDSAALYREARQWNDRHAEPLAKFHTPHGNASDPERRLRIGYVSPDLCDHALAYELIPLLANHDHRQVEVYCYAEVARADDMTQRFRACADTWRSTVGMSDEQFAGMVRQDGIDILVDLALHTGNNRLLVFARKPAPVQVSWLGYPGTTGMTAIDYRLTDPYLDPPGQDVSCYSEQTIHLPETFLCYDPLLEDMPVEDAPALANGMITFGFLGNFCKVNDGVLRLWAKVLAAVPRSRLLLLAPEGSPREHVLATLGREGIAAARVEFAGRQSRERYMRMYNRIDIGLDLLPYNGHATSLDAFWMGVPTVTLVGRTIVGRAGLSVVSNLGLPELAGQTPEEYVAIAAGLAADIPRLQELRAGLRDRLRASPLMDGPRFARNMEQIYRQLWCSFCARAAPRERS
jgi:predicted O-linked N-acetylglucosamine transferase (SPINDLY family)